MNMKVTRIGNPKNVFELGDITDIPDDLKSNLKTMESTCPKTSNILKLFEIKSELTIDEILVGLYRMFGHKKTRVWVSSSLYNLSRKKMVTKSDSGVYKRLSNRS